MPTVFLYFPNFENKNTLHRWYNLEGAVIAVHALMHHENYSRWFISAHAINVTVPVTCQRQRQPVFVKLKDIPSPLTIE